MNPVRQNLCRAPADYPFLGSFTQIGQKMLKSVAVSDWMPPWKRENAKKRAALEVRGATFKSKPSGEEV
jgi:hypothetical protein